MEEYEIQLQAVNNALIATTNETERAELEALKENLLELLELTKQQSEIEGSPSTQENASLDNEMQRFMSELNELTEDQQKQNEIELEALRTKYSAMVGDKCAAPHEHSWGALSYHNALICGIEDNVDIDNNGALDVRLRVLFTNPTHREMLPCTYYLEGECRFDETRCHFSHGEVVSANKIKDYNPPDFERLSRNCAVLAKLQDRIWHRGHVLCVNFMEQQCRVRLDSKEHKERERDFKFEELFPIINDNDDNDDEDLTSDSDSGSNIESTDSEESNDLETAKQACLIENNLFEIKCTQRLGEWEQYTRGIGSKLMAQMGYIHGTGLGSDGRGIVQPISAEILPPGRSLDACMELREAANGDKDYFSVEKKLKLAQKKQQAINEKAYARQSQRVDVFSFLNDSVLGKEQKPSEEASTKVNSKLQEQSTKSLNVESVRIADDIRRKEREISKMQESIKRNAGASEVQKRMQTQLIAMQQEMGSLQRRENSLNKEQNARRTKNKMFEF